MVLALVAAAATVGVRAMGIAPYNIASSSMEPALPTGSLAYVKTGISDQEIRKGDVIAFDIGHGRTATHRVVALEESGQAYVTKGDANVDSDPGSVAFRDVRGKVVWSVPLIGRAASFAAMFKGPIVATLALFNALLCAAMFFLSKMEGAG